MGCFQMAIGFPLYCELMMDKDNTFFQERTGFLAPI